MTTPTSYRPTVADELGADWLVVTLDTGYGVHTFDTTEVGPVTIRRGRRDASGRFDPAVCTFSVPRTSITSSPGDLSTRLPTLRDRVDVELSDAAATALATGWPTGTSAQLRRRFQGTVTDVAVRLHPDDAQSVIDVTATGNLAPLRRAVLNDPPASSYAAQLDGARASTLLGQALTVAGTAKGSLTSLTTAGPHEPGTVTVAAMTPRPTGEAGSFLDELAAQTRGDVVELRDGTIVWHDADHRVITPQTPVRTSLPTSALLVGSTTTQRLDGLANRVRVTWGSGASTGTVTAEDSDSVGVYGLHAVDLTAPLLTTATDGQNLADLLVKLQAWPRWQLDELTVDVLATVGYRGASGSWSAQAGSWSAYTPGLRWSGPAGGLLAADVDELLYVEPLSPFSGGHSWLEGVTETLARRSWRLQLTVTTPLPGRKPRDVPGPWR